MNRLIDTIENCPIYVDQSGRVFYTAKLAVDDDGSDNRWRDPDWQADTSLHYPARPDPTGKAIDAGSVPFIVVPPAIPLGVAPKVLGCRARATFRGISVETLPADIGPHHKLGEGSVELARRLGIPDSPISGGDNRHEIFFELWPGVPAVVDGKIYELQSIIQL